MLNIEDGRQKHEALHIEFTSLSLERDEMKGTFYELVSYEQADLIQNS
jgi:hypothetical protein